MPSRRTIYRFAFSLAIIGAILAGYEVLMQYGSGQGTAALSEERIRARAPGHDAETRPTEAAEDSVRVPGVQLWPEHQAATGDEAAPDPAAQLASDLADADANVRQQALFAAAGSGDPPPRHTLEQLLSYDESELARRSALEALNVHPEVDPDMLHALLLRALRDPSPLVRESAAAIAEGLATPMDEAVDYSPANTPASDAADSIQTPYVEEPSPAGQ